VRVASASFAGASQPRPSADLLRHHTGLGCQLDAPGLAPQGARQPVYPSGEERGRSWSRASEQSIASGRQLPDAPRALLVQLALLLEPLTSPANCVAPPDLPAR